MLDEEYWCLMDFNEINDFPIRSLIHYASIVVLAESFHTTRVNK